jgi:tripartite-type tricarboxylate transporter receptor subunit TctC
MVRWLMATGIVAFCLQAAPQTVAAQEYPRKTVTMIVPFAAGGATDVIARIVSEAMSRELKTSIVIENVAGAGGTTGSLRARNAEADGHTLLVGHMGTHASSFALYSPPRYDPRTDFEPIGLLASAPIVLFTRPQFPASNLAEFTSYARSHPMTVAHSGVGSNAHLTCALLGSLTQLKTTEVPYRGNAPLMTDLTAGIVDYSCDQIITVASQISGGQVKGIAITGSRRSALLPDVPTFAEAGLPTFDADAWTALFVRSGVQGSILDRIHQAYVFALKDPSVVSRLQMLGAVAPGQSQLTREYLGALVERDVARWAKVVREAGIAPQQ